MPHIEGPPEPWRSFFTEVDSRLNETTQLHCCGGFVATQMYGVARTTSDVDFLSVVPNVRSNLVEIEVRDPSYIKSTRSTSMPS